MGREGESYLSPKIQREAIQRWADYKNVQIACWHEDQDVSGSTHRRPGLDAAVARALNGETSGIVSWKIDRFSRQTEAGLRDLRRLQQAGARLAFVVEDVDTATVYGRMVYTILLAVSEAFLENIKAGWEITKARAVQRGAYISRTPFGYRRTASGTLEPDLDRAPIVREAFRLAAADTLQAAMSYLQQMVPERRWTLTTTRRLIHSRAYLGETRSGSMIATATHERLVSEAVWLAAQDSPSQRQPAAHFPLSGVVRCETCHQPLVGGRGGKGQRVYRCSGGLALSQQRCPQPVVITAQLLEDHVRQEATEALAGLRFRELGGDLDRSSLLERDVREAEAELEAFAGDLTMRRALGDRYHAHLQARVVALDEARKAFAEHARSLESTNVLQAEDVLERPRLFALALRSMFGAILVRRGRGSVGDRVRFVALNDEPPAGKLDV